MVAMAVRLRISDILTEHGMTQAELSRAADISLVTINAMASETRPVAQIRLQSIDKLCKALKIKPGDLFEIVEDEPVKPQTKQKKRTRSKRR